MKNSTLIRIKVPKALYESALRKALLEVADKDPDKERKGGHKGKKYAKEDDYDNPSKKLNPAKKHKEVESKKGGGAHKGKAFVGDDAYTDKVSVKKTLGETKKKKIKEAKHVLDFLQLKPERDIAGDAQRLGERKRKMEEKRKVEERKHKIKETKEEHDDTAEDTKLIKRLVKPSALKGSKK